MKPDGGIERYLPQLSEGAVRWARFAGVLVAGMLLLLAARSLSAVVTPIVAALAVAYVLNPVVTYVDRNWGVSRLASVTIGLTIVVGVALLLGLIGALQIIQLTDRLPAYAERLQTWVSDTFPSLFQPTDRDRLIDFLQSHGNEVGAAVLRYVGGTLSNVSYWLSLFVLMPMYTFFFLLHFNTIVRTIHDHLPDAYRDTIVRVATTIDRAVSDFFRGRLIVCLFVAVLSGVGWSIVRVPYALPLGALAGTLNLIPFASGLALVPALTLAYAQASELDANWVWALAGVFIVFAVVQAIESFLLSPIIESQSSGLHPITIIVALLIGAQVAGLLGMLLSIPIASTLKSLSAEYVLPEIRRLARPQAAIPAEAQSPNAPPVERPSPEENRP